MIKIGEKITKNEKNSKSKTTILENYLAQSGLNGPKQLCNLMQWLLGQYIINLVKNPIGWNFLVNMVAWPKQPGGQ